MLIKTIDATNTNRFWIVFWTLNDKLLSRSSWSLVVRAKIRPVGVTSNQLNGDFRSTFISYFWTTFDVLIINLAKKTPFKYNRQQTIAEIMENIQM